MDQNVSCVVYRNENYLGMVDIDIVFIHGIDSSNKDTWCNENKEIWPSWLVYIFPNCRILLIEYPSAKFIGSISDRMSIIERSTNIANILFAKGVGSKPTIYVCHSLGGILIKEMFRISSRHEKYNVLFEEVIGIVFLATPHKGSPLATLAKVFRVSSKIASDLISDSNYLIELKDWFSEIAENKSIAVSSYCEKKRYKNLIVVDQESADPNCISCITVPLDYNHITITKPRNLSSDLFTRIFSDIQTIIKQNKGLIMNNGLTNYKGHLCDLLRLPVLTNSRFSEICHCLQMILSEDRLDAEAMIFCLPVSQKCTIITKNSKTIKLFKPVEERWPNHFSLQNAIPGEFVTEHGKNLERQENSENIHDRAQLVRFIAELIVHSFDIVIDLNVSCYWGSSCDLKILSVAHDFYSKINKGLDESLSDDVRKKLAVDNMQKFIDKESFLSSSWIDRGFMIKYKDKYNATGNAIYTLLNKTCEKYKIKAGVEIDRKIKEKNNALKIFMALYDDTVFRKDLIGEMFDAYICKNEINARLHCHGSETKPIQLIFKIKDANYSRDIIIFSPKINEEKNEKLTKWLCDNKDIEINKNSLRTKPLKKGELCTCTATLGKYLTIDNIDEAGVFPFGNKFITMSSLFVLSGSEIQYGDSGSPIKDSNGKIVGVIIGKTANEIKNRIFAASTIYIHQMLVDKMNKKEKAIKRKNIVNKIELNYSDPSDDNDK